MAKKILYSSNFSKLRTGFGKHSKVFLSWMYQRKNPDGTPKYEVVEYANGIRENDPCLKSVPWKAVGSIPTDESYLEKYRRSDGGLPEGLDKLVMYGGERIDEIIKQEKPDVTVFCEDPWGFQSLRFGPHWNNQEWFKKSNVVLWWPSDSLPQFKDITEKLADIPYAWVKSTFAAKDYHRMGHDHVRCFPFLLDTTGYRKFSKEEKSALRTKYNISQETKLIGFVFRNQGRKKPISMCEGLKLFLDSNPGADVKLVFLTNLVEGWDIRRAMKEIGLSEDKVLFVHLCRECGEMSLLPSPPENPRDARKNCPKCQSEASVVTPSVELGVTEKQLSEVYNLMDGYIHQANSGGFEGPIAEAMFHGVPCACPNYSYGEMFVDSEAVFPLDHVFDREIDSNFKKAVVLPEAIVDFISKICFESEEMEKQGQLGLEWANSFLNPERILLEIEEVLDDMPEKNYDFDFHLDYPNPDAEFPNIEDEDEFITELIYRFFGRKVDPSDQNFQNIKVHMSRGMTREQAYHESIRVARSQKKIKFDPSEYFTENGKKRLLYEMPGDYGDSLLSLTVLDRLRKLYNPEEWDIYVSCLPQYREIYAHLDWVKFVPFFGMNRFEIWEGSRNLKKHVDVWLAPSLEYNYIHNGQDLQEFHKFSDSFLLTSP